MKVNEVSIFLNWKIQENYAGHLIDVNDEFVGLMLEFEETLKEPKRDFSEDELVLLTENIEKKNDILKRLQNTPPNKDNLKFAEMYKDMLRLYAFYIQGESMRFEYAYLYKDAYTDKEISEGLKAKDETLVMGTQLVNMMGSLILENPLIINGIAETNIESKYQTEELRKWLDDFEEKANLSNED